MCRMIGMHVLQEPPRGKVQPWVALGWLKKHACQRALVIINQKCVLTNSACSNSAKMCAKYMIMYEIMIKYNENLSIIYTSLFIDVFFCCYYYFGLRQTNRLTWKYGSNSHVSVWLLQVGICFVFWQGRGGGLWLRCCGAELTLCVRMRFFYALFHTEHS